jgi:phage terminase large subunit-like protein
VIAEMSPMVEVKPGYRGLLEFAERIELHLEPFQRKILRAVFGPEPEVLILVARGAGKTTLMGLVVVHHLLTVEDAKVYVAASSKDQARILFEAAAGFAREVDHPNVVHRHLELRWGPTPTSRPCSPGTSGCCPRRDRGCMG